MVVRGAAGLHVGLTADQDSVEPGEQLSYTLIVSNTDVNALPFSGNGVVTATLPAGTSFVSASGGGMQVGNEVQWNIGSVAAGSSQRYSYTVAVDNGLDDATVLQSEAQIWGGSESRARAMATAEVQAASPLRFSMTAGPDPVVRGGRITYRLQVSNVGSSTLTDVVLQSLIPDVNGHIQASKGWITGGGTCPGAFCNAGEVITWPTFVLAPGQTRTVLFDVLVNTSRSTEVPDGTVVHNAATVTYSGGSSSIERDVVVDQ